MTETATTDRGDTVTAEAQALVDAGELFAAIELLEGAIRARPSSPAETLLAAVRHQAYASIEPASAYDTWPVPVADLDPSAPPQVPVVEPADLSADAVRRAVRAHGSALVPGLFDAAQVERFTAGIKEAIAVRAANAGTPYRRVSSWFAALQLPKEQGQLLGRPWIMGAGGMLACDSPRMLQMVLSAYEDVGLRQVLTDYLGERPILSANKCTLREVPLSASTDWHQDGAFMGSGIRALNVWVALTDCGVDAPGMDLVPRRFEEVQETGTGGAIFDWAVGPDTVAALSVDHPVVRPEFKAGDALLFDDLYLHRTGLSPDMVRPRYAIESWFFAATDYPDGQIPLVW